MFMVMTLIKERSVRINSSPIFEAKIDMDWADGMEGVLPVFEIREDAEIYADGVQVIEISEA